MDLEEEDNCVDSEKEWCYEDPEEEKRTEIFGGSAMHLRELSRDAYRQAWITSPKSPSVLQGRTGGQPVCLR